MTEQVFFDKYFHYDSSKLRELILRRNKDSEEALYFLLHDRLRWKLQDIYNNSQKYDEFADMLMEFFLYLRDGRNNKNTRAYEDLEGIRSWFSFESWVCRVFRNFMAIRANEIEKLQEAKDYLKLQATEQYNIKRDEQIHSLGVMIANINQSYIPKEKFIFYRSLLSKLNKEQVIPNERMSEALGLTYDNYRQIESRIKSKAKTYLHCGNKMKPTELDPVGIELVERVERDFDNMGELLRDLYENTLLTLDCKDRINALRYKDVEERKQKEPADSGFLNLTLGDGVRFSRKAPTDQTEKPKLRLSLGNIPYSQGSAANKAVKANEPKEKKRIEVFKIDPMTLTEYFEKKSFKHIITKDFSDLHPKGQAYKAMLWMLG